MINFAINILRQIEDGKAGNWPKLQEAARDPVVELVYKLLHDRAVLRKLKSDAMNMCTVTKKAGRLELVPADERLDRTLEDIARVGSEVAHMETAVSDLEQIFSDLKIKDPLFKNIQQREDSITRAIDRSKAEISLCAKRIMHMSRLPMNPEEVLADPRYTEVRAEQTRRIEQLEADLVPIAAAREKAESILDELPLVGIDISGGHYLVPA